MSLQLVLTVRAEADLAHIRSYLRDRNPAAAERVRMRIRQTLSLLCDYPNIGRPTIKDGVLVSIVPRFHYKIYFSVIGDQLMVLHVRHGARQEPDADDL